MNKLFAIGALAVCIGINIVASLPTSYTSPEYDEDIYADVPKSQLPTTPEYVLNKPRIIGFDFEGYPIFGKITGFDQTGSPVLVVEKYRNTQRFLPQRIK